MVDIFTSVTDTQHKNLTISFFAKSSHLIVVVATVAFGLGLNCTDVHQIVCVGMSDDLDSYIQETGCAGSEGQPALITLLEAIMYISYL